MRVSTELLDHGHDVCGAQLHSSLASLISKRPTKLPIAPFYIWQLLTRIGVPPQMIAVIRQKFHDRMRSCVRPDDGVCLDWFEVGQGFRQGCVLSPLLFIFFTAVLTVVLRRSAGIRHPRRAGAPVGTTTVMGPEPAMDYVSGAVWVMLHADDACV